MAFSKKTLLATTAVVVLGAGAYVTAAATGVMPASLVPGWIAACFACNPCAAANPCNPCGPLNPCAAKNPCAARNPCNPCAAKNPCNPCAAY